jgi:hypothetical protein
MSTTKSKPSKRSIVGSMGLPAYEKPEEPEWMLERERRNQQVLSSEKTRQAALSSSTGPSFTRSAPIVAREDPVEQEQVIDSEEESVIDTAPPAATKPAYRAPPPIPVEEPKSGGMMGKFKGMTSKKSKIPPKAPDVRRRNYNKTFGQKSMASSGSYYDEERDEESLSPQEDRARIASAFKNGRLAGVGLGGALPVEEGDEETAEDVKSAAKARDAQATGVVGQQEGSYSDQGHDVHQESPAEEPDVRDDESAAAIVMAPALSGGYLDEQVPSYDLTDPSKKTHSSEKTEYPSEKKEYYSDKKDYLGDYEEEEMAEKSNGYAKKGAAAAGVTAAGAGAAYYAEEHYDQDEPTYINGAEENEPEEEEPYVAPVKKEKKPRPAKSPKRETQATGKKEKQPIEEAAAGAGAAGIIAEEEEQEARSRKKKASAPRKQAPKRAKVANLTVVQRHYLLKALVSMQMQHEFSELEKLGGLTLYGYPFALERPKLKRIKNERLEGDFSQGEFEEEPDDPYADADEDEIRKRENLSEPLICRQMFHVNLHTFPGLDTSPVKYWTKRIQPFFDEMAARNFSTSMERGETTSRRFYTLAMTRYLGSYFSRGFGVRGEGELRGPGKGAPGSDRWGKGKEWGKGTVKRGLDRPLRPDADMMDKIDNLFDGREGEVWKRARKETARIKRDWQGFKEFVIEKESGLEETMNYLDIGNLKNLPPQYRNAEEYARYFAAYIFHTLLVTSPSADSFYSVLKGIHLLFPYWGAKQMLKIANAQTMIQAILGLLLARPAGAKSLVQRIFVSVVGGQASSIDKENIKPLRKAINEPEMCAKIEEYVQRGARAEGRAIRSRAVRTGQDVVATILLYSAGTELSSSKKDQILDWHDAFASSPYRGSLNSAYPDTTPVGKEGKEPQIRSWGESSATVGMAKKYAMLKLFLREVLKRRDREEACKMAGGSLVPSIIKESLDTVFYGPIRSIAEVSDLSARLGDLQAFFDDIIKTKKAGDNSLPAWVALTARHENSLYFLFHECSAIVQPFTEWLQKGCDYMALGTTDPAHPANRKAKNIEVNLEEMLRDGRLTDEDVDDILAEVDQLARYAKWNKIWYELELRKNYLFARGDAIPASGLCEDDIPSGNMKTRITDVDGLLRELMEQEGEDIEEGIVSNDARGTEMKNFPWAWFDQQDPLHQHLDGTNPNDLQFEPNVASVKLPTMKATRKALDPFRQTLLEKLPAWKEGDARGVPATPQALLKQRNGDAQSIAPSVTAPAGAPAAAVAAGKKEAPKASKDKSASAPKTKASGGMGGMFRVPFTGR